MRDGVARAGWDIDLRHGEAREDAFVHVLLRSRVEHKSDGKCRETGNLFIEYKQKGRPSGIATTTADWWAIEYDEDCWVVIPTTRLKAVARRELAARGPVRGGDFDNYEGVLVPFAALGVPPVPEVPVRSNASCKCCPSPPTTDDGYCEECKPF